MLSLATARKLKDAGLRWMPALHDFFALPDRDLDDRVFVITDVMSYVELLHGSPMVSFHGTAEWALDYVLLGEAVWLPSEEQLRLALLRQLQDQARPAVRIAAVPGQTRCTIAVDDEERTFEAADGPEAYAQALLFTLDIARLSAGSNGKGN
jgi:hypothetical protein